MKLLAFNNTNIAKFVAFLLFFFNVFKIETRKDSFCLLQNSNLVLQVDYNYTDRRGRDEPTGEVMPLRPDMLTGSKMGDKFKRENRPDEKKSNKR